MKLVFTKDAEFGEHKNGERAQRQQRREIGKRKERERKERQFAYGTNHRRGKNRDLAYVDDE